MERHLPMTLCRVQRRAIWVLPAVAVAFVVLAVGAAGEWLPWDDDIRRWTVDHRSGWRDTVALRVSWFGSTYVVITVAAILAALAARRWPRLAVAIVVLTLARPVSEFLLKELVGRERPVGDRLVRGRGPSFPSGHPYAVAASWGTLPLVVAAYTGRRILFWSAAIGAWLLVVMVAASRVWLGVHWTSDVVAGVLLSVLGVAAAERLLSHLDPAFATTRPRRPGPSTTGTTSSPGAALDDLPGQAPAPAPPVGATPPRP